MFLCLFAAYPCVTSLRFSYASLCYSITVPFFSCAMLFSSSASHFHSLPLLCPAVPYKAGPRSALPQQFTSLLCQSISVQFCAVHISAIHWQFLVKLCNAISFQSIAIPLQINSVRRRSLPFLFCSIACQLIAALRRSTAPPGCATPLLCCSRQLHSISSLNRSMPPLCFSSQFLH